MNCPWNGTGPRMNYRQIGTDRIRLILPDKSLHSSSHPLPCLCRAMTGILFSMYLLPSSSHCALYPMICPIYSMACLAYAAAYPCIHKCIPLQSQKKSTQNVFYKSLLQPTFCVNLQFIQNSLRIHILFCIYFHTAFRTHGHGRCHRLFILCLHLIEPVPAA